MNIFAFLNFKSYVWLWMTVTATLKRKGTQTSCKYHLQPSGLTSVGVRSVSSLLSPSGSPPYFSHLVFQKQRSFRHFSDKTLQSLWWGKDVAWTDYHSFSGKSLQPFWKWNMNWVRTVHFSPTSHFPLFYNVCFSLCLNHFKTFVLNQ